MKAFGVGRRLRNGSLAAAWFTAIGLTALGEEATSTRPAGNVILWDTLSPMAEKLNPGERSGWKVVPNDLLLLEKDPPKASSDPGYYGREYSFQGDAAVQIPGLLAVFCAAEGCVRFYANQDFSREDQASDKADWGGGTMVELSPVRSQNHSAARSQLAVVRNTDDEVVLEVSFSPGTAASKGLFTFDKSGIVEVKPRENMKTVRLSGSVQYGIAPTFVGDDLIFDMERCGTNTVGVPSENLFLGLLSGENSEMVLTWPKGKQQVKLRFDAPPAASAIDFDCDSQSFYLAMLSAPGIWHKESLRPDYLEKDIKVRWKRPFPAKWKTQLTEEELKTTYAFRGSRGEIWRGVAGSYVYPVWFEGDEAYYHLGKKVPPEGESLIYCVEGRDTPLGITTPADILKQTLGRQTSDSIVDVEGRKLRTHHRRAGLGVRRACTCGCTEAIQAVFEAGDEVSQKDYIQGALDDMIYFVHCHVQRINEYRQFADGVLKFIQEKKQTSPQLNPFLNSLEQIAQQIPQECSVQKDNMKTFDYADELARKTMALAAKKDTNNLKEYMELLKAWRAMGGAQDYVLAKCHVITRSLAQAAGYNAADATGAVPVAQEIRVRCRQTLRNADGYEIWADY